MPCVQRKAMELGPMTHFGSVNHVARQLRSVVVTWDATSCRHGTDIEMLYGPQLSSLSAALSLRNPSEFRQLFL